MRIWRISNFTDLSGRGGLLVEGRWHFRGTPVVYCTDHPSTALLEILVHTTRHTVPDTYQLIGISVPDAVTVFEPAVQDGWDNDLEFTRRLGADFLKSNQHALMKVPSVIMPKASNYLLNPQHPDAPRVAIAETYRYPFDSLLLA